jgi:hypothetical protein
VSKRYVGNEENFWYALQGRWVDLFKENPHSFLILAMTDSESYIQIPWNVLATVLGGLNLVEKGNKIYYQIALCDNDGDLQLRMPRNGSNFSLHPYTLKSQT